MKGFKIVATGSAYLPALAGGIHPVAAVEIGKRLKDLGVEASVTFDGVQILDRTSVAPTTIARTISEGLGLSEVELELRDPTGEQKPQISKVGTNWISGPRRVRERIYGQACAEYQWGSLDPVLPMAGSIDLGKPQKVVQLPLEVATLVTEIMAVPAVRTVCVWPDRKVLQVSCRQAFGLEDMVKETRNIFAKVFPEAKI